MAVAALLLLCAAGPMLVPRAPDLQEDVAGARYLAPLSRAHALRTEPHRLQIVSGLRRSATGWDFERAGVAGHVDAADLLEPPASRFYLLGTDGLGRDLASRLAFGARHSVLIATFSVALALVLGTAVGAGASLGGARWDWLLMRGVDVFMSIPRLLLYLLCAALLAPSTLLLVFVLGATTWTGVARLVRAELLALRDSDLTMAARSIGAPPPRVLWRHLLPQMGPMLAVSAALRFADTILLESALAFLGMGSPPPAVSLGAIIASGREALASAWWIATWPGLLIGGLVLTVRAATAGLFRLPEGPSAA